MKADDAGSNASGFARWSRRFQSAREVFHKERSAHLVLDESGEEVELGEEVVDARDFLTAKVSELEQRLEAVEVDRKSVV